MYKKIYVEITNICNLSCNFCSNTKREKKYMSLDEFKIILNKLEGYTKYLYFHILGEPLMHPKINEFINLASKNYYVNITTNGYLIKNIKNNKFIRQLNISLHSYNKKYNISLEEYLNNIFDTIDILKKYTYISLRLWTKFKEYNEVINYIKKRYNIDFELKNNIRLIDNIFLSINKEFIWPDLNNNVYNEYGKCYALKDHIGILSNGVVIPCCLDSNGIINLGNIFETSLDSIIKSNKYQNMLNGFKNNKKIELLCRKCNFLD